MDTASLSLTGNMVNLGVSAWNTAGDVLTVSPISVWPEGPNQGLAIDAGDLAGNPLITLAGCGNWC